MIAESGRIIELADDSRANVRQSSDKTSSADGRQLRRHRIDENMPQVPDGSVDVIQPYATTV